MTYGPSKEHRVRKHVLTVLLSAIVSVTATSVISFADESRPARSLAPAARSEAAAVTSGRSRTPVRVFTIAMFEAEAEPWIENENLTIEIDVPGSYSPVYCRAARGTSSQTDPPPMKHCLVITGMGAANAAATLTAVGTSRYFDLTDTYFLVAGIAGTPPSKGTLGAAAWADWIVDGDLAHHIDAREMPDEWEFPYFRLGCSEPWCDGTTAGTEVFQLNTDLVDVAYELSKDVELADSADAAAYRANYPDGTAARSEPFVTRCDSFSSSTFWHGKLMSDWAEWWSEMWTNGLGEYCMSNMEDIGTVAAFDRLADSDLVDWDRLMVLRTASNFDQPYPEQTAQGSISSNTGAFRPSVENAYRVGVAVTDEILQNWKEWKFAPPAATTIP